MVILGYSWNKGNIKWFFSDEACIVRFSRDSSQRKSLAGARDLLAEESLENRTIQASSEKNHLIFPLFHE